MLDNDVLYGREDVQAGGLATVRDEGRALLDEVASRRTTRRSFIKGIVASGAAASAAGYVLRGPGGGLAQAQARGQVERLLTLKVNGQDRRVDVLPQETLAETLRYKLNLTGTKVACDRAECGACTVMLDGVASYSCSTLTHSVRGREVTTVEGIAGPNGALNPVQRAFIQELAPQCGFCTPAQVVTATAFLKATPKPTVDQARLAMSGVLCRCGAYDHYLRGVMRAASA
jgi:aerobic-type carbon monoxide dehydrogenase small subunit (CoxS/CutS family)